MPIERLPYTASVRHKHTISLLLTIFVAAFAGLYVAQLQQSQHIDRLLTSNTIADKLSGIALLNNATFDQLVSKLSTIVSEHNEASSAAQALLVKRSFMENRVDDLQSLAIEPELYAAARWWNSNQEKHSPPQYSVDQHTSPWVHQLVALYSPTSSEGLLEAILHSPLQDRDGSILLATLAIEKHLPTEKLHELILSWSKSYDVERQKVATLLAALTSSPCSFPVASMSRVPPLSRYCLSLEWSSGTTEIF